MTVRSTQIIVILRMRTGNFTINIEDLYALKLLRRWLILHSNSNTMKKRKFSFIEILLIECIFLFAFFGILKYLDEGNPRFFIADAVILLLGYLSIGTARYIEIMKKEESDGKDFTRSFSE